MRQLILLTILLLPSLTWACSVPPRTLSLTNSDLVRSAEIVVLAKAINYTAKNETRSRILDFTFEVEKILKGGPEKIISLPGYNASEIENSPGNFGNHMNPEFWAFDAGNSIQLGNCVAYGLFETGKSYLLIIASKSHTRAYEQVSSLDDLWYKTIEVLVLNENLDEKYN